MKILVICQHYYPEPLRIADICEGLVKEGHQVTVVTGTPNYPMGYIYDGYKNGERSDEIINGVNVHRCNIIPRRQNLFFRFLNYYSFPISSSKYINSLDDSFDVVLMYQLSPVLMAKAGLKYAKKHNKKSLLYCLDLWPASLSAGNVNEKSLIGWFLFKWFYIESKKIYRNADKILTSSKSFFKYFKEKFDIDGVGYLPQYAEDDFDVQECEKKSDEYIDLMFAGNIGAAQSIDVIINAAHICKDIKNLRWHIIGDGKELEKVKKLAAELDAPITFYDRKPVSDMPKYYKMADAMLVSMKKDDVLNLTLPGKVQSYLASGKPIIGAISGETKELVEEFNLGFCAPSDDADALAESVRKFCDLSEDEKDQIKKNAINCYKSQFEKSKFIDGLILEMKNLISELELITR